MTSQPPRPDEDDLARFHNGDTLDNIPVVRLPGPAASSQRRQPWTTAVLVLIVGAFGALAGVGIATLTDGSPRPAGQAAGAPKPTAPARTASASMPAAASATPWTEPSPTPTGMSGPAEPKAAALESIDVIESPETGGDPSVAYCLVYTGSESDGAKEAILLANAPAYQCRDMLSYDPNGTGAFFDQTPVCEAPSRPALLTFVPGTTWAGEALFTCLRLHTGA